MKKTVVTLFLYLSVAIAFAQADKVSVANTDDGSRLLVNGNSFMINGMNWDYFPIGTNYNYSLWTQPDNFIRVALDSEMSMLKNMGVNTIRAYSGIQPKWIKYIYEKYGIWTIVNHTFGRYGLTINGVWIPNTEYADAATRNYLINEATKMANEYKGTPGLLAYLLGNENNYGLFWSGAETENIPVEQRQSTHRAKALYKVFNDATLAMKKVDSSRPIAICNGDMLFIDIIADECKDIDILGVNCYRGVSFGDVFEKVKKTIHKPMMFTEFGSDAFNTITNKEDQASQAYFLINNWKEIYENAAGLGKGNNSIGGMTFQFSDGWWKYGQTSLLDVHDTHASWVNGGYSNDYVPGENNMNEEWYGICAKGQTDEHGHYQLYPRAAYYALKQVHELNPFDKGVSKETINKHFSSIQVTENILKARADQALLSTEDSKKFSVNLRGEISTYQTGGTNITTPKKAASTFRSYPNKQGFDNMESFYLGVDAKPADNIKANVTLNILGNVASNPIDEVFYENRARQQMVNLSDGTSFDINRAEHIDIYKADFNWSTKYYNINGFYRTGHYHWGYEGDFFGLYPETNYGPNLDIYHGAAPFGFEVEGKMALNGVKVAYGPQLWWGANPAILMKYSKDVAKFTITGIYQEDLDKRESTGNSVVIPVRQNRKATIDLKRKFENLGIELGGIWAGEPRIGETFQLVSGVADNYTVYQDKITSRDTWGAKAKVMLASGPINWYAQGAVMGLVADGGADWTKTYTGWRLKDSGSGNQYNFLTGLTYTVGNFQIAPNFLWQKPIIGPMPINDASLYGTAARARNIEDDPFAVRANRETVAGELLIGYDPTPATWMYDWDNDVMEDAPFAINADFVYRHLPTTQDATFGYAADRTRFTFNGATPAHDLWEVNTHIVSKLTHNFGFIVNLLAGTGQANGIDTRIVQRYGGDLNLIYKKIKLLSSVKVNDWGPYDYHRDYNLTYPLQIMADLSAYVLKPKWINMPDTKLGIRGTWRSLDQYSGSRLQTNATEGTEWEFRTYVNFNIGK